MKKELKLIAKGIDNASKPLGKVSGAVSGLGKKAAGIAKTGLKVAGLGVAALGTGAIAAGAGIMKLASDAAKMEDTRRTFGRLTDEMGGQAKMMDELKESTRGLVNENDLMQASNKFLSMGLTDNVESTAEMSEMATQLGMAMGEGPTESMENFALMMANQSIPRLDSFGISSSKVRERIKELQEANADMTREQAFNTAVMEQGAIAMERVGEQAGTTGQRFKASMDNIKNSVGKAFAPALDAVMATIADFAEQLGPKLVPIAEKVGEWFGEKIPIAIDKLGKIWNRVFPAAKQIVIDLWNGIKPGIDWIREQFDQFTVAILPHLRSAWDNLKLGFQVVKRVVIDELMPAIRELADALGIGQGKTDDIGTSVGDFAGVIINTGIKALILGIRGAVILLSDAARIATDVVEGFKRGLERIRGVIQWVKDRINELRDAINSLTLPDWLTPGSPTPFEIGLRGIGDALVSIPEIPFTFPPGDATTASTSVYNITNKFGSDSVRSDDDIEEIMNRQEKLLRLRGIQTRMR